MTFFLLVSLFVNDLWLSSFLLFTSLILSFNIYRFWKQFGFINQHSKDSIYLELTYAMAFILFFLFIFLSPSQGVIGLIYAMPVAASFYGLIPELFRFYKTSKKLFVLIAWIGFSFSLYLIGFVTLMKIEDSYLFNFAGISTVLTWRLLIRYLKPSIQSNFPSLGEKVYGGPGAQYFSGLIIVLIGLLITSILKLNVFIELLSIIAFYLLLVAVALEMLNFRQEKIITNQKDNVKT